MRIALRCGALLCAAAWSGTAVGAELVAVTVDDIAAVDGNKDGVFTVSVDSDNVALTLSSTSEQRGVFEFDISSIPSSATITSASFTGYVQLIGENSESLASVALSAHAGDGDATASDANVAGTDVGGFDAASLDTGEITTALDTAFFQGLLGSSDYAALVARLTGGTQVTFASTTSTIFEPPPTLTITYVPEPASLSLLACGMVGLARRRAWSR